MIRPINLEGNLKVNVFLKTGVSFLGKDITQRPCGDHDRIVAFWDGDVIIIIPMTEVKLIEFFEDK